MVAAAAPTWNGPPNRLQGRNRYHSPVHLVHKGGPVHLVHQGDGPVPADPPLPAPDSGRTRDRDRTRVRTRDRDNVNKPRAEPGADKQQAGPRAHKAWAGAPT